MPMETLDDIFEKTKVLYRQNKFDEAIPKLKELADKGLAPAQALLGNSYFTGKGVPQDYGIAVELFHKALKQGYFIVYGALGYCYYYGKGAPKDYTIAVEYYQKAAKMGNIAAQTALGECYRDGIGVMQDMEAAAEWFRKAAKRGDAEAQQNLDKLNGERICTIV